MYQYNRNVIGKLNDQLEGQLNGIDLSKAFLTVFIKKVAYVIVDHVHSISYLEALDIATKIDVNVVEVVESEEDQILVCYLAELYAKVIIKGTIEFCNGEFSVNIAKNIASRASVKLDN